jgi:glycerophosphoryl diester phosphodiesterase
MLSLRAINYVAPPVGVRSLAQLAGLRGVVSLRELMDLLGQARFGPAPVYLIGHNTNSIAEVRAALAAGANAIEIDVTAYEDNLDALCIDHAGLTGDSPGDPGAPRFSDYLRALRPIADQMGERLALVVFDVKSPAATPAHGRTMLKDIRAILTSGTRLNIVMSVADVTSSTPYKLNGATVFDDIVSTLDPREGLMVDQDDSPDRVASFFRSRGVTRFCYGNGTSFNLSDEGAMVYRTPIEQACWMRATKLGPRFIYAWTVNGTKNQRLYLRIGVNGIIADVLGLLFLSDMLQTPEFAALYRRAQRSDNLFLPPSAAYGLTVHTSNVGQAGTDANVTFTVTGTNGSRSTTMDANYNRRLERGLTNFLVLTSPDLGDLLSVTVQRDNDGNAPDWHLAWIVVESFRYRSHKTAVFACWIDSTAPFTRGLA